MTREEEQHPKRGQERAGVDATYQRDWPRYFDAVSGKPPRETALNALKRFAAEGDGERLAIDIACGEGRDSRAILATGRWRVISVDSSEEALRRTKGQLRDLDHGRCEIVHATMEALATTASLQRSVDFVNASFALPFCQPEAFPLLWTWVQRVLKPGGRFAGQFFGDRDDWYVVRPASHVNREHVESLLSAFEIEHLEEVEKDGDDAMGGTKHHHVFHVVAKKR